MATLTHDITTEYFKDYTLKLKDADRIRIEVNGEYITYLRVIDGVVSHLATDQVIVI